MAEIKIQARKVSSGMKGRMKLAQEHMEAKRFDEAIEAYESILKDNPEAVGAYMGIGTVHFHKGNYDEAENYFKGALHLNDKLAQAKVMLANLSEKKGDLQLALKLNPKLNMARLAIGRIYTKMKNYKEAEKSFREALRHNPQFTEAGLKLSEIMHKQGQTDKAIANLEELLNRTPASWQAHMMQGKLFMRQDKYKESIKAIQRSMKIKSDNPMAFLFLGQAYIADEQFDQAIDVLNKALSLNPDLAKIQLSKAYICKGSYDEARKILHELSMGKRGLGIIHFMLADIYTKEGKYDHAVAEYEAALLHAEKLTEKHPEILNVQNLNVGSEEKTKAYQKAVNEIKLKLEKSMEKDDSLDIN